MNSRKRAKLPLRSDRTKGFEKDWVRLTHSGRYNMAALKETMLLLIANDGPLPAEYLDHALAGEWNDHRECHVGGDFLLIYRVDDDEVVFVRAGTHAELFK
ncbi:type II toxin-antitoxin system YafQ family toxin [Cupriavidus pauculus]|uniref:Type II toxin-antitoxin system YafQ family toxin n=1 Tax=Cupriavidus pauculus TaxID=82633 RepID=A0A5P2H7V9_9BURK|nr:type II toxin-antitoxin system YafQ family toxin [Cupriavidus pauculus]QET04132.1 type II toxin-antitoxin system YafQ family toxin [Cupriavidus pauculus]